MQNYRLIMHGDANHVQWKILRHIARKIMVAALAHQPSIFTDIFALCSFNRVYIATAANTSPPPELIRTVISSTAPKSFNSWLNTLGVISSPYHEYSEISPYNSISAVLFSSSGTKFQNLCTSFLFLGFFLCLPSVIVGVVFCV